MWLPSLTLNPLVTPFSGQLFKPTRKCKILDIVAPFLTDGFTPEGDWMLYNRGFKRKKIKIVFENAQKYRVKNAQLFK